MLLCTDMSRYPEVVGLGDFSRKARMKEKLDSELRTVPSCQRLLGKQLLDSPT